MNSPPATPEALWVDRVLDVWFDRHPVDATFVGLARDDNRLPDLSSEGVAHTVSSLRGLLEERPSAGGAAHELEAIDSRLAAGALRIRLWEYESGHMLGNPSLHAGEAVFSMMASLLADPTGGAERRDALAARMEAVPRFLEQASGHLDSAPRAWTERALRECRGGLAFLRQGLLHSELELSGSAAIAEKGIESYAAFLSDELLQRPSDRVGCGEEAFDLYLREGHCLTRSADEIAEYAREEMERTKGWLEENATEFGETASAAVTSRLADLHPTASGYYSRYEEIWAEMKQVAEARELVTWPDHPIRYVPRPEWSRAAAPDLYFLFYRSPAAYHRPEVHRYMVAPLPDAVSEDEVTEFLRANNDSVIKLNHVVHHGGIGHHVQNWHAFRSPLRMGRVSAVDCASRIAMFCGGTMAEGWACYATDLMGEAGALTPLEQYAEHAGRVRMCARAIVDVELHHGRMTLDDAAAFYTAKAGMPAGAAMNEAVKNSMFPAAAMMYLIGTDAIHELRADLMRTLGDRFDLRGFHDAFLSWGSIPVQVVADEMRRRAGAGEPLGAHERSDGSTTNSKARLSE